MCALSTDQGLRCAEDTQDSGVQKPVLEESFGGLWGGHKNEVLDLGLRADVWGSGEQEG